MTAAEPNVKRGVSDDNKWNKMFLLVGSDNDERADSTTPCVVILENLVLRILIYFILPLCQTERHHETIDLININR